MDEHLARIKEAVIKGNRKDIEAMVQQAVDAGVDPNAIINHALIAAMDVVGQSFSDGDMFVPEMMVSATAMKMGLAILKPLVVDNQAVSRGTILIGTVRGDLHDIGKNLVAMMFEGAGFSVIDLGVDVRQEFILEQIKEHHPEVLGLSALLTTTMPQMKNIIDALEAAQCREAVKVIIGGAPVSQNFADKIGADGYAADASEAVQLARGFVA